MCVSQVPLVEAIYIYSCINMFQQDTEQLWIMTKRQNPSHIRHILHGGSQMFHHMCFFLPKDFKISVGGASYSTTHIYLFQPGAYGARIRAENQHGFGRGFDG